MRNLRISTVAAAAVVGLVTSLGAAPASAATTYVTADDLGVETPEGYPEGWFVGTSTPPTEVAPYSTDEGLVLEGKVQLLHGGVISNPDLSDLVDGASVAATGDDWTFQIPVFLDPDGEDKQFTTFRPAEAGTVSTTTQWVSSRSVGNLTANQPVEFSAIEEAFDAADAPDVLAYGVFVDTDQTATLQSVTWGDDTSIFTPVPPRQFNDIANNTFRVEIEWLSGQGITTGYDNGDGTFSYRGSQAVLREQMAAFLYRYENEGANPSAEDPTASFSDVPPSATFSRHIAWLADLGITTGYSDGTFRPSQPVLREQMAAFLYRLAGEPEVDTSGPSPFADLSKSHVFYEEILWLEQTGVTYGYYEGNGTRTFRGSEPVLREQMAAFLFRFNTYEDDLAPR